MIWKGIIFLTTTAHLNIIDKYKWVFINFYLVSIKLGNEALVEK